MNAENNTSFLVKFSARVFLSMLSECTFGDNSDKLSIFQKNSMNLVDRGLTEYQIIQTLILSRLHAQLEQTRGIRLFTRESDCLINLWSKQVILRSIFRSMKCETGLDESVERINSWSASIVDEKYEQNMLRFFLMTNDIDGAR